MRSRRYGVALLWLTATLSCGREPQAAREDTVVPPTAADTSTWTIGETSASTTVTRGPVPVVTALRTAIHPGYERVTVELGPADGLPGYHVEYVDRPLHECGSGNQIFPVGDAWLQLRLEPAAAHTEAGEATLGVREVAVEAPLLERIYRTCDFEAVVVFVLAVSSPNPFRVSTLSDPWRVVVDIQR